MHPQFPTAIFPPPDPSHAPHISVAIGITVGLLASFVQSLGLTIQRKSHLQNQARPENERVVQLKRPLWLIGFAIFISSNILGSIFQIASLPVIILAPLGAVSLLWNAFFSRLLLGDHFHKFILVGTALIVSGAIMIAIGGIVPEPTHSLEDLLRLFERPAFVVYFSLLGSGLGIALIITHIVDWSYTRSLRNTTSPHGLSTPPSERTPLIDPKLLPNISTALPSCDSSRTPTLLAISYASASGTLSGMCLLFAKSGVELLLLTASGDNQFRRWESWALVGGLIVFALMQLWYLNKSLVLADPTLVCPLAFCFYNVSTILNGLVYYNQFSAISHIHLVLVITGVAILLGGVYAVSGGLRVEAIEQGQTTPLSVEEVHVGPPIVEVEEPSETMLPIVSFPTTSAPPSPVSAYPSQHRPPPHARTLSSLSYTTPPISPTPSTLPRHRRTSLLSPDLPKLNGFAIGLSAVSPGFGVIPKFRRRRETISGLAGGETDVRRSVSESGVPTGNWNPDEVISRWRARDRWRWIREKILGKKKDRGRMVER